MIQSTNDASDINAEYPIDLAIVGDAKLVLRQVIDEVKEQAGPNRPNLCRQRGQRAGGRNQGGQGRVAGPVE